MVIENQKVAEKIQQLIADKRSAHLKKIVDVYTTSLKFRHGIEFSMKMFKIEKSIIFAFVNGGFYGFIADNENEVLERLGQIKARITPPERVLAKSLAIRVKRINDEIHRLNKEHADYRTKYPQYAVSYPEKEAIKLGYSVEEFCQNLLKRMKELDDDRWHSEIRDIKRLIEIDKIGDEGFQRAYNLLITNEVLTE